MTAPRVAQKAYTIEEVAELKSVSPSFVKAAIKRTEGNILRARNIATAAQPRYRIDATAVEEWWSGMGDA